MEIYGFKLQRNWVRDSDHLANDGHYEYEIVTDRGWIALTKEQNDALEALRVGAWGNPLENINEEEDYDE